MISNLSQSSNPVILSSVHGRIKDVLLVFPGLSTRGSEQEYDALVDFFDQRGTVHKFFIPDCNFKLRFAHFRGRGDEVYRKIHLLNPTFDLHGMLRTWAKELDQVRRKGFLGFERWVQDPFVVLGWQGSCILLQSLKSTRACDFFLPLEVVEQLDGLAFVKPSRLYIEGGNLLMGMGTLFVGKDLVQQNVNLLKMEEKEVLALMRETLGVSEIFQIGFADSRRRLEVGGGNSMESQQPFFHIDLFMNLGGRNKDNGKELVFLANPALTSNLLQENRLGQGPVFKSDLEPKGYEWMEETKVQLLGGGFEVVSLPIFILDRTCYSWNNCLVEVCDGHRKVILPDYLCANDPEQLNPTFRVLQDAVASVFENSGFEVEWIHNGRFFRTIARHGGSLHCVTKVLRRFDCK